MREAYALIFFCVSFFIYGTISCYYYLHPSLDPVLLRGTSPTLALPLLAGLFFLYGVYGLVMHTSWAGKIFSTMVTLESLVVFVWQVFLTALPLPMSRLSGAIEGGICFCVLLGLLLSMTKGASVWK